MNTIPHRSHRTISQGSRRESSLRSLPPHNGHGRVIALGDWLAAAMDEMFEEPRFYHAKRPLVFRAASGCFRSRIPGPFGGDRVTSSPSKSASLCLALVLSATVRQVLNRSSRRRELAKPRANCYNTCGEWSNPAYGFADALRKNLECARRSRSARTAFTHLY